MHFPYEAQIGACTAILASSRESAVNRSIGHNNRGGAYLRKGDYDRAIADFDNAIRLDPRDGNAYNNRGLAYTAKGDFERAMADLDEAIRRDPGLVIAYNSRGQVYLRKGDYDRAIADFNEGIKLHPTYAEAYNNRGNAYNHKGDFDRAIADYTESIRLKNPDLQVPYYNRGNAYQAKGDFDRAIGDYDEVIRLNPKHAWAHGRRGIARLYGAALASAHDDLNQASDLDPKNAYLALWLELVERRNGLPTRLKQLSARLDMARWPAPVVRLLLGELTLEQALAAADHADPKTRNDQACTVHFLSGQLALLEARKDDAQRLFRLAAADCSRSSIERSSAQSELRLLGVRP
jgi:tetratricopeptide (TPR) repeat protein